METLKMKTLVKQIRGVSYKPEDLHDGPDSFSIMLLRANNIVDGKIIFDDVVYVDKSRVSQEQILQRGDILICASSGSKNHIGKAATFNFDTKVTFGAFCKAVRPFDNQNMDYISMFFQSPYYRRRISESAIGANINNIRNEHIDSLQVQWSTDEERKRAVKVLTKIYSIIQKRKEELKNIDDLVRARFVEMFGDFKINSMGWPIVGFEEIATIDGNMTTDYEKYADYPHIGIDSIEKETGLLKGYRTVAEDGVISGKYVFTPAHIIYSKIRPNLNKVALPDFEGLCSADAYPILPIEGKCNRVFLAYDMRSTFFLDYILQFCNRTNLPKVNRKEVTGFKTPLPPLELQNKFAAFVAQVDKSKVAVQKALDEAQLLFDSLMQEYFG